MEFFLNRCKDFITCYNKNVLSSLFQNEIDMFNNVFIGTIPIDVFSLPRDEIMCNFASEILCPEMSNQLFLFLIPSLAEDVPIAELLQSILRLSNVDTTSAEINPGLMVNTTPWLLYGLLSFGEKQIGRLNASCTGNVFVEKAIYGRSSQLCCV